MPALKSDRVQTFPSRVAGLAFSPCGKWLAVRFCDRQGRPHTTIRICDPHTARPVHSFEGSSKGVKSIAFSPDGTKLIVAGEERQTGYGSDLTLWSVGDWSPVWSVDVPSLVQCHGFASDGMVVVTSDGGMQVSLWSARAGKRLRKLKLPEEATGGEGVSGLAVSPEGDRLACFGITSLAVCDAGTGKPHWSVNAHPMEMSDVVWTPDGQTVATTGEDGTVRLWDARTGKRRLLLQTEDHRNRGRDEAYGPQRLAVSPDGGLLACSQFDALRLWTVPDGALLATLEAPFCPAVAISPDGRTLAAANGDETLGFWDLEPIRARKPEAPPRKPARIDRGRTAGAKKLAEAVASANRGGMFHSLPPAFDLLAVPEFARLARVGVRLHPRPDQEPHRDASRIGGQFLWPGDEPWPVCREHDEPFAPVIQLVRDDFPELRFPPRTDVCQVLWCPHRHESANYCPLPRVVWRRAASVAAPLDSWPGPRSAGRDYVPAPCRLNPERVIEFPHVRELDEPMLRLLNELEEQHEELAEYEAALSTAPGCKLGGWPDWIQDPYYPECPSCGRPMPHLLTIASIEAGSGRWLPQEDQHLAGVLPRDKAKYPQRQAAVRPTGLMLGDDGNIHVFICYDCDPCSVTAIEESS